MYPEQIIINIPCSKETSFKDTFLTFPLLHWQTFSIISWYFLWHMNMGNIFCDTYIWRVFSVKHKYVEYFLWNIHMGSILFDTHMWGVFSVAYIYVEYFLWTIYTKSIFCDIYLCGVFLVNYIYIEYFLWHTHILGVILWNINTRSIFCDTHIWGVFFVKHTYRVYFLWHTHIRSIVCETYIHTYFLWHTHMGRFPRDGNFACFVWFFFINVMMHCVTNMILEFSCIFGMHVALHL